MKYFVLMILLSIPLYADRSVEFTERIMPLLHNYCFDCHDPEDDEHDAPFFEAKSIEEINEERHSWKSVAAQLRNRTMPPKRKKKQPTEAERMELSTWIEDYLKESAKDMPDYAGYIKTRRLNRTQYANTIRDLFGFDLGFAKTFPKDSSGGEGFDNNGETLYLPPLLMERYMEATGKILDRAIATPTLNLTFSANNSAKFNTYLDGNYRVKINYEANENGSANLKIDGLQNHSLELKAESNEIQLEIDLDKGFHYLEIDTISDLKVISFSITQRFENKIKEEAHDKLFLVKHDNTREGMREAAFQNLKLFMEKAFRRPVDEEEVSKYMMLYNRGALRNDPYEECFKLAMTGVMLSPHFLFMIESYPESSEIESINSYELASRLSYFIWSSLPDQELMTLASSDELQNESILEQQITRMLQDPKAYSFYENFTSQWLGTDEVGGLHSPNGSIKKEYNYNPELGMALREEPIQFFKHIAQKNRPLVDLIDSNYVVVNRLLAKHYGMRNLKDKNFRKVKITNDQRGGLLGLGGVHMASSFPGRTSPVLRGAWVIETILGTPVPAPPEDVPDLAIKKHKKQNLTVRQIFEMHRENASCAACHDLIDPIGFGLDNYDLAGRWRTHENGAKVNSTGSLPTGETFNGPKELKIILMDRKDEFLRHLSSKILGYALGRSLMHEDAGNVEQIFQKVKDENYSSQALIKAVVLSTPFRNRQLISENH